MKKEKPAYKLTRKEAIPFRSSKNYMDRNVIAYNKGERDTLLTNKIAPRLALTALYDIASWFTIIAIGYASLEKLFE